MYYVNTHPDACTIYVATILCRHVLSYLPATRLIWLLPGSKVGCWQNSPSHDHLGQFGVTKLAERICPSLSSVTFCGLVIVNMLFTDVRLGSSADTTVSEVDWNNTLLAANHSRASGSQFSMMTD